MKLLSVVALLSFANADPADFDRIARLADDINWDARNLVSDAQQYCNRNDASDQRIIDDWKQFSSDAWRFTYTTDNPNSKEAKDEFSWLQRDYRMVEPWTFQLRCYNQISLEFHRIDRNFTELQDLMKVDN